MFESIFRLYAADLRRFHTYSHLNLVVTMKNICVHVGVCLMLSFGAIFTQQVPILMVYGYSNGCKFKVDGLQDEQK